MPQTALVTFTAKPLEWLLRDGGSGDWRLDAERAQRCEYLVCTQNRHNADFGAPTAPHGAAFLIGRISEVVRSSERHDRWVVKIGEYLECNLPNIWGKSGHLRYPVWYTTLEELGIDLAALPSFRPLPRAGAARGMAEMGAASLIAPDRAARRGTPEHDAWRRLNAILDQIDRVPDLPAPSDPLDWDEHGLPR
jgi:hypothetical protein